MKIDFGTLNELEGRSFQSTIDILSRKEAALVLGVCLTTFDRLDIPRIKIRRRVMIKREALNKWINEQTESPKRVNA